MHKIILTSQARRDMHQIKEYISRRLQNPIAATSERVLACKNYLAFYRIEKADVYIDRVLHGRQDYLAILFGENLSSDDGDI